MRQVFNCNGHQSRNNTHKDTQNGHIAFVADVLIAPFIEFVEFPVDKMSEAIGALHGRVRHFQEQR